jgi:microcystin-dependent protein
MAQNPISNMQASLALTQYMPLQGVFPSQGGGGGATGFYLGEIGTFAGAFAPAGTTASGQFAAINQNQALFSLLGTYFGGNGTTTFELPNLTGTTMVGTGQGAGLSLETIGQKTGSASVTINYPQAPPNLLGQSQSFDNHQPSLGITYEIETQGVFPSQGGGGGVPLNSLGMIKAFAGNFEAGGYMVCDGRLLSIAQNQALFALLGTTYGGNGTTTFALPDLRGRDIVGASAATPIGTKVGQANVNLVNGQAPTAIGGPVTPFDNRQPSLAMEYVIALQGIFPTQNGGQDPTTPFLGQVVSFAGNFVPSGWALCDGSLLSISQNTALFAVLGTFYGGNGTTTFALPDLRDRTVIGAGNGVSLGEIDGENSTTITADELPVPPPRYGGALVAPGQFDTWLPIDSVQTGGGYQIAWKHGGADEYIVWNTDGNGNWLSQGAMMSGTSFALESLEPTFGYDLTATGRWVSSRRRSRRSARPT